MKLVLLLLLCVVSLSVGAPVLILRKKILEYPVYVTRDVTVSFNLYNIGTSAAHGVELIESGLKDEWFTPVIGSSRATWKSIPAGQNVTHTFVLRPKRATRASEPFYGYPAVATYSASETPDKKLSSYSNDVGAFHIYQRGELAKKIRASTTAWVSVVLAIAAATLGPLGLLRHFQQQKKKLRKA